MSVLLLVNLLMMLVLLIVIESCLLSSRLTRLESQRLTLSVLVRDIVDLAGRQSVAVGRVHVERRLQRDRRRGKRVQDHLGRRRDRQLRRKRRLRRRPVNGQRRQRLQRRAHLRRQRRRRLGSDARRRLVLGTAAAPSGEETGELLKVALRLRRRQLPGPPLLVFPPQRPLPPVRPLLRRRGRLRE